MVAQKVTPGDSGCKMPAHKAGARCCAVEPSWQTGFLWPDISLGPEALRFSPAARFPSFLRMKESPHVRLMNPLFDLAL